MTLAEARAIVPGLATAAADPGADARALTELARWCERYTPLAAPDDRDGLLLDISGCGHLFGGEKALMEDLVARLASAGIHAQAAVAPTPGASWALARYRPNQLVDKTGVEEALAPLPVKALRLHESTIVTLRRLGLKRIGDILALPRPALARRFRCQPTKDVSALLMRLDQALGRKTEPINPLTPLPSWRVRHAFIEPALHLHTIENTLPGLIDDLLQRLSEAEVGVRRVALTAFRVDGTSQQLTIGTNRASRDSAHLIRLFAEKTEGLEAGYGFDLLMLSVLESERLAPAQVSVHADQQKEAVPHILDRLTNRLGTGAVMQLKHRQSHIPERTQTYAAYGSTALDWQSFPPAKAPRPCRLLLQPEAIEVIAEVPEGAPRRFRWRRVEHKVIRSEGPERIAHEWWLTSALSETDALTRDYYRIEVAGGSRFWVFRRGLFAVPGVRPAEKLGAMDGPTPNWFMHGFFA